MEHEIKDGEFHILQFVTDHFVGGSKLH